MAMEAIDLKRVLETEGGLLIKSPRTTNLFGPYLFFSLGCLNVNQGWE